MALSISVPLVRAALLGLVAWAGLSPAALAQKLAQPPRLPSLRPAAAAMQRHTSQLAITAQRTNPTSRLGGDLQRLYTTGQANRSGQASVGAAFPQLRFSKDGGSVLVHITAQSVATLLPSLLSRGFVTVASYPDLHFVEGMLPVSQLAAGSQGVEALAAQGLLGVLPSYRPLTRAGAVTSQGDIGLEAARARATRPKNLDGTGVRVGVISDSFNALNGAATDISTGDLPATGVQVLLDDGPTDEGRAMCQIVHDLVPGSPLAFSTANVSEGDFANQIVRLADPALGNCQVIVDDVGYFQEPFFQDGVIARAITQVVNLRGVTYFSSAGNNANNSYEKAAPTFINDAAGVGRLNFSTTGVPDVTQRFVVMHSQDLQLPLQWSDPFYTARGVKTDLDVYLVRVRRSGVVQRGDTVASSTLDNIATGYPAEFIGFSNDTTQTHTTAFDLHIVRRAGTANPTRLKYVNELNGLSPTIVGPTEWQTNSGTIVGHAAAAAAIAVAAVRYDNPRAAESFTSRGMPTFLFATDGTALGTPEVRQKPNLAAIDGVNTSSFGTSANDYEGDGFPNFFGTSAAAPHAAAVAALLRQSEPGLTPAQVYARLTSTARLIGTTTADPLTGAGLVDAFTAIYGPAVAVTPPAVEDLEKGALPTSWTVSSTRGGRVQVVNTLSPASGTQHLLLDSYPGIPNSGLNEAVWYFTNVTGSNAQLTFRERKFAAEIDQVMPATFTGSSNTDGVALSVDGGTTWYRVFDLTGTNATTTYQTQSVNLTQLAAADGLTLGNDVRLKFQQYGTGAATGSTANDRAGRVFDDIAVTGLAPAPVALYNSTQSTFGCPGLTVQYADTSLFKPTSYAWTFVGGTPATATVRNPSVVYATPGHYPVTLSVTNANGTVARTDTGYVFVSGRAPLATVSTTAATICPGGSITFSSTAAYCPGTYSWSFPGGSPATSTAPNPGVVAYATAGTYAATLTVSNTYGSSTTTIPVAVGGRAIPFAETFDNTANSQTLPTGWNIVNPDQAGTWVIAENIVGRNGLASRALRAPFWYDTHVGEHDAVYTPALNLTGLAAPTLLFDLAYGKVSNSQLDSLSIQVADACTGAILGKPYAKGSANTLPTTTPKDQTIFLPTATDWRQERVDLTPYAGKSVVIRFVGRNGNGQYLYLDNVQVGNSLLGLTSAASAVGLEAWPVPTPRGTSLNLRLPAYTGSVSLRLVDNLGRTVWQQQVQQSGGALERTLALPFAPGLYNLLYTPASGTPAARRVVLE
jgi:PKD repeat protein